MSKIVETDLANARLFEDRHEHTRDNVDIKASGRRWLSGEYTPQLMYMEMDNMYIGDILEVTESTFMKTATKRSHKHFQLDSAKIKRAQRALHAKTETEAIERALDFAIAEHEKNRVALQATERFVKSGIEIKDVYGTLVG